jgi:molybdopterin/thiamine biosynthesis adenylyltransferase
VPWYEQGELKARELEALAAAGYPVRRERIVDGRLVLGSDVCHGERRLDVEVHFSFEHPFVAPTIFGAERVLNRHQQAFGLNFCLDRNDRQWWNPDRTAADLLHHLEGLLGASASGEIADTEADMAEPISGMVSPNAYEVVVISGPLLALDAEFRRGQLRLVRSARRPHLWAVEQIEAEHGAQAVLDRDALARLGIDEQIKRVRVPFRAIEAPDGAAGADAVHGALNDLVRETAPAKPPPRGKANELAVWAAVTYTEEGPRRGERQRSWLIRRERVNFHTGKERADLLWTQALDLDVRQRRIPELRGLEACRFVVVGAGSLGGHVISELARAGVGEIDIVDGDDYDINNSVRHVLPIIAAGRNKAEAMRDLAAAANPHGTVRAHPWRVGDSEESRQGLVGLISNADVVVDATGAHDITRLLHWRCATLGARPLISGALTPGGYGGRVVTLRGHSPCFDCFLSDPDIPRPAEGPIDNVTPYGCAHPAASCAGFDVAQLAAITTRTAVRAVRYIAYPRLDHDWAIVNFRPPQPPWAQGYITPQPDCAGCDR